MNIDQLTDFFMWGTILAVAVLAFSMIGWLLMRKTAHHLHQRLFGVSPGTIDIAFYAYLGLLKALTTVFFILPWISLLIIGEGSGT